jgi:hypothetical protein
MWKDCSWPMSKLIGYLWHYTHGYTTYRCMNDFRRCKDILQKDPDFSFTKYFEDALLSPEQLISLQNGPLTERISYRHKVTAGCAIIQGMQFVAPGVDDFPLDIYKVSEYMLRADIEQALTPRWLVVGYTHAYPGYIKGFEGTLAILKDHLSAYFPVKELRIEVVQHSSQVRYFSHEKRRNYFAEVRKAEAKVRA